MERWDGHAHVIGDRDRFPLAPGRSYDPPPAPLDDYLALLDRLELDRGLLVQPSVYGFDNRCMLDALDRAAGRLVGVAVPPPDASPGDLEALHRRGVRGIRCNRLNPGGLPLEAATAWGPTLADLGWHVEVHAAATTLADIMDRLDELPVPVVVDHMGRPGTDGLDPGRDPARELLDAVADGRCFVKLSAPYRLSAQTAPWPDVAPLARALLDAEPDACLWATDWPHTDTDADIRPDHLLEALADWRSDPRDRDHLLAGAGRLLRATEAASG